MEMIMIPKKKFDELFKETRNLLKLRRHEEISYHTEDGFRRDVLRTFNFEVCQLKSKLEEA